MSTIVVGVDESPGSAAALRWAVTEGQVRGWTVQAVLSWNYLEQHHGPGRTAEFDPTYGEAQAMAALDEIIEHVVGSATGAKVERRLVNDHAGRGLVDLSAEAGLLVVGARGLGAIRSLVLGSVSQYCLHHARCPVAIVHADAASRPITDRVVVGVDGSMGSAVALEFALAEARARRATLEVVHSWTIPAIAVPYVPDTTDLESAARQLVDEMVGAAGVAADDPSVTRTVLPGAPAGTLLAAGDDADVIVVGSRGHGGFKGLLLGSVSHQVASHSTCPTIVVPHAR
jgi:nucleotide-binding universal stress UspA family protein